MVCGKHLSSCCTAVNPMVGGAGLSTAIVSQSQTQQQQHLSNQKAYAEFEGNFKILTRGVVAVAVGLSHNKEVKDFFVHLVEKVGIATQENSLKINLYIV